jgi:hypothetical protein
MNMHYLGDGAKSISVHYLGDGAKSIMHALRRLLPIARPCTLQEYLICCAGIKRGIKD